MSGGPNWHRLVSEGRVCAPGVPFTPEEIKMINDGAVTADEVREKRKKAEKDVELVHKEKEPVKVEEKKPVIEEAPEVEEKAKIEEKPVAKSKVFAPKRVFPKKSK